MVTDRRARRVVVCAAVLYLLGVARMTLWPDFASPDQLDALRSLTAWLTGHGVPVTYEGLEATANVVMFVPFGVLGGLLVSHRHRGAVVAAGCAVSAAIETSQLMFLPTRVPTIQDVVLNTAGAAVGLLGLAVVVAARRTRRSPTSEPAAAEPDASDPDATRVQ
ncbi:VanZ family protein [Cellulomonas sp. WB94]|uniref:VanZ family protein n=1 Tax=Cellulomonas sp. WB94 TaxID=2173174 RepID=UPI000D570ABB|nr:VanZ family protein [Cellulomonas sp. WB94]PVU83411.1 VanZ family protein [Cellulomonas sp. WB94]